MYAVMYEITSKYLLSGAMYRSCNVSSGKLYKCTLLIGVDGCIDHSWCVRYMCLCLYGLRMCFFGVPTAVCNIEKWTQIVAAIHRQWLICGLDYKPQGHSSSTIIIGFWTNDGLQLIFR